MKSEVGEFIDKALKCEKLPEFEGTARRPSYEQLRRAVGRQFGAKVSKAAISKRAKAIGVKLHRGRRQVRSVGTPPAHSIPLDSAGAFFLRGAELETGVLATINQLLRTSIDSVRAKKALSLAQQINATLLFAPLFGLRKVVEIARYSRRGLVHLSGIKAVPQQQEIEQYLRFLMENKMLLYIIKEVTKNVAVALWLRVDFGRSSFYLDAQTRTVWPGQEIPECFDVTIHKAKGYVEGIFKSPSVEQPLILQTCPGYNTFPTEMFNLINCFEQAPKEGIAQIVIGGRSGRTLGVWRDVRPKQRCLFLAPLTPWQLDKLSDIQIVKDFKSFRIGPEQEPMNIAEARVSISVSQLVGNINVRAALVKRKHEELAIITNISLRQERYIRKIVDRYFWRWPDTKVKTYYDLMEDAQQQMLERFPGSAILRPSLTLRYAKEPLDAFRLLLEHLHLYTLNRFFPTRYAELTVKTMMEKIYCLGGFLKINRSCQRVILQSPDEKSLKTDLLFACQRLNQSGVELPDGRGLNIQVQ